VIFLLNEEEIPLS